MTLATAEINKKIEEIQQYYQSDQTTTTFNALITGEMGTGKTSLLKTCRKPILIHSFDPGGTKSIRDAIYSPQNPNGYIIVDTRFEKEDPRHPSAFKAWDREYEELKRLRMFEQVGTYCIDSATTWAEACLNAVMQKGGRISVKLESDKDKRLVWGGIPTEGDWMPQMQIMSNAMADILSQPCDFILTAHLVDNKDALTGKVFFTMYTTGKLKIRMPAKFDEVYVAVTQESAGGITYRLLTQNTGVYRARTRLGANGKFEAYEEPNIKALLKKAGLPTDDKPIPWLEKEVK